MKRDLNKLALEFKNNLRFNYDLKNKNWFNIGGKTEIFYKANDLKELIKFLKRIENKEKIFVLGGGTNTLISDKKFNGVVIKLANNFNKISILSNEIIVAGSSVADRDGSHRTRGSAPVSSIYFGKRVHPAAYLSCSFNAGIVGITSPL